MTLETDQLRLENYRGSKKSQYITIGFYPPPIELMIFLFQLIFAEWVQLSCPHCTTISWIHLYILFG